jgi:OOP family OmpA-OmpF porin
LRLTHLAPSLLAGVVAATLAPPARADSAVDLRTFRASTDAHGTLATEGITTPGHLNVQAGHWFVLESASLKIRETSDETRRTLGPRLIGEPTIALGLGRRAALGAVLPYVLYQDSSPSSLNEGRPAPSTAIGDVTLTGKGVAKEADPTAGGLGIAFVTRVQLPTGDRSSFISDRGAIAELRALVSFDYLKVLQLTGTAGYRMRFRHHDVSDVTIGDTIPWGATLAMRPIALGLDPKKWLLAFEARGEIGAVPNKLFRTSRVSPTFVGLSARYEFAKDLALFTGFELGIGEAIGAPLVRGILGITYAPTIVDDDHDGVADDRDECPGLPEDGQGKRPHDGCPDYEGEETPPDTTMKSAEAAPPELANGTPPKVAGADADGDGIPDDADKCPDQAETKNGYEDEDGCPELDKDNDTFLDAVDHCPDKAETFNGYNDDDGCPDELPKGAPAPLLIEGQNNTIALARPIKFDVTAPAKEAGSDLRALAAWILAHPGAPVRVAVRPEGKGDEANKLAMTRAISIVEALVRYAHTGGIAEAVAWDPKSTSKTNVALTVPPVASAPKP